MELCERAEDRKAIHNHAHEVGGQWPSVLMIGNVAGIIDTEGDVNLQTATNTETSSAGVEASYDGSRAA